MPDGKGRGTASWIAAIVAMLLLVGSGATAYSDLNSKVLKNTVRSERSVDDIKELDRYDVHLEGEIDSLKGSAIRTEVEMSTLQRATEELKFTMSELLNEMRRMNDNLIRMGASDGGKEED